MEGSSGSVDASERVAEPSGWAVRKSEKPWVWLKEPAHGVVAWANANSFFSITRTSDELSIVCLQSLVPDGITVGKVEKAMVAPKVELEMPCLTFRQAGHCFHSLKVVVPIHAVKSILPSSSTS